MANAKISQLPAVTAINGADLAVVVQAGTTSQTSVDDLFTDRTMVAPLLGTPASGNLSNCTDLPIVGGTTGTLSVARGGTGITSFGAGVATFLGTPSSANLAAAVTDETGSGLLVFATSPTLTTPTLGVAAATSINKVALTAPATGSTLTIADGKTLTASNTLTLAGTDSTTMTFPGTSATIARTDAANSFTGNQTIGGAIIATPDTRTGPGAVSVTTTTTAFISTGTGDALTLADGTAGQIKVVVYTAEGGGADTGVLTPANRVGYASVTLSAIGDSVTLLFIGTGWAVLAANGATVTP
jgi:hypothetical protein